MKDKAIKEGFQKPEYKIRKVNEIAGEETEAAGNDPDRQDKEGNKIDKAAPPEEKAGISGLPNAPAPQ